MRLVYKHQVGDRVYKVYQNVYGKYDLWVSIRKQKAMQVTVSSAPQVTQSAADIKLLFQGNYIR